jgi:hypothetical protein
MAPRGGDRQAGRSRQDPARQGILNRTRGVVIQPQHRTGRNLQLEPAVRRQQVYDLIRNGLEMPMRFGLELDVPGEWLDTCVLEGEAFCPDSANKLDGTSAVGFLGKDQVAPRRALPRLDVAQDRVAGLSFIRTIRRLHGCDQDTFLRQLYVHGTDVVATGHGWGGRIRTSE